MKRSRSSRGSASAEPREDTGVAEAAQPSRSAILLSVAGLTPQVITETLYCLTRRASPPVAIREIRVVTTTAGEQRIREQLLRPRDGGFFRFCTEYGIPAGSIRFDPSRILVPRRRDGSSLDDVRTPADNALVADCILSLVRDLTRDPGTALHCSMAGGRKTMGLFLGIAFQLFARPQDRLSHVLVWPPELEGHREFFYPPPRSTTYIVNGHALRSRDVRVELAEIPVLLLRERIRAADLGTQSYMGLVKQAQQELDRLAVPPVLIVDSQSRSLRVERETIGLTPLEFAVYSLLARRRAEGCGNAACPGCPACSFEAKQFLDPAVLGEIRTTVIRLGARDQRTHALAGWRSSAHDRFLEVRSRVNAKIRGALGTGRWVDRYCITAQRRSGALSRYLISAEPSQIILG